MSAGSIRVALAGSVQVRTGGGGMVMVVAARDGYCGDVPAQRHLDPRAGPE